MDFNPRAAFSHTARCSPRWWAAPAAARTAASPPAPLLLRHALVRVCVPVVLLGRTALAPAPARPGPGPGPGPRSSTTSRPGCPARRPARTRTRPPCFRSGASPRWARGRPALRPRGAAEGRARGALVESDRERARSGARLRAAFGRSGYATRGGRGCVFVASEWGCPGALFARRGTRAPPETPRRRRIADLPKKNVARRGPEEEAPRDPGTPGRARGRAVPDRGEALVRDDPRGPLRRAELGRGRVAGFGSACAPKATADSPTRRCATAPRCSDDATKRVRAPHRRAPAGRASRARTQRGPRCALRAAFSATRMSDTSGAPATAPVGCALSSGGAGCTPPWVR